MPRREEFRVVLATLFPGNVGNKIFHAEYFGQQVAKISNFSIVDADGDHPVIAQQSARQSQTREQHIQPVRVEPARSFSVRADFSAAFGLASQLQIVGHAVPKIVRIHEILARVVGRIDIDQLHLAGVAFLQELQHFEIVALDHQVLRRFPIDAFVRARQQGSGRRCQRDLSRATLAVPVQPILFVALIDCRAEQALQHLEVDPVFRERLRKQRLQRIDVARHNVGALRLGAFGIKLLHDRFQLKQGQIRGCGDQAASRCRISVST